MYIYICKHTPNPQTKLEKTEAKGCRPCGLRARCVEHVPTPWGINDTPGPSKRNDGFPLSQTAGWAFYTLKWCFFTQHNHHITALLKMHRHRCKNHCLTS